MFVVVIVVVVAAVVCTCCCLSLFWYDSMGWQAVGNVFVQIQPVISSESMSCGFLD